MPITRGLPRACRFLVAVASCATAVLAETRIDGPVIGIDLGTTYSCAGVYKNGQVEIIPNRHGSRLTPSVVAFTESERLTGEAAREQAELNPSQTLFGIKRLIGRQFDEDSVQKDKAMLPFDVVSDHGELKVAVSVKGAQRLLKPEAVSAAVLSNLKESAEQYLGTKVQHAVIAVPAHFNSAQRQATKDAGAVAGLTVVRMISEPTAAAMAYGLDSETQKIVFVYDLGGGTFDVSLLKAGKGSYEVVSTAGEPRLGGEDFDQRVVQHFVKAFEKKHGKDLSNDKVAVQRLRQEAEKAKRVLSSAPQARVALDALHQDLSFSGTLSRARFEELNQDLFQRTVELVKRVLKDAGMGASDVDSVLLVGGSTRIPKIQQLVQSTFGGKAPARGINPDEAVAYGAAMLAGTLSNHGSGQTALLLDVTPLTLGIETVGGVMTTVIGRSSPFPTKNSTVITTHRDSQPAVDIKVYEGERLLTRNNHFLGKFRLGGVAPAPRGQPQVEVTFSVDADGILSVEAADRSSAARESLTVTSDQRRLSAEQIEAMIKEAEEFAEEDAQAKAIADARVAFKVYLSSMRSLASGEGAGSSLQASERSALEKLVMDGQDWLVMHLDAEAGEIISKHAEVEALCSAAAAKVLDHGSGEAHAVAAEDDEMEGHDEL